MSAKFNVFSQTVQQLTPLERWIEWYSFGPFVEQVVGDLKISL
jgi:hypothetical protein